MKKFDNALKWSFYIFSTLNGWDSALVIGVLSFGATMATFGIYWLAIATAIVTTLAVVYTIDIVSTIGLLPTMQNFKQGGTTAVKRQYCIVFAYLLLLSAISFFISMYGREYITEIVVPTPPATDVSQELNVANQQHTATIAAYDATIKKAESERRKVEKAAGSPWLKMQAEKGNTAAKAVLAKEAEKAGLQYTATIQTAQAEKIRSISAKQDAESQINTSAKLRDNMELESAIKKRSLISGFLMWVAIGSLVMMWITAITRASLDASDGQLDGRFGNDDDDDEEHAYTPPPVKPQQRTSNLKRANYSPTWFAPINKEPVITEESPVITTELEELDIERDNDTNCITAVKQDGVPMDKTKMNEFFLTYKKRAEDSSKEYKTRSKNYFRAQELNMALYTIYGVDRRHVVPPPKPKEWVQQNLFNQTTWKTMINLSKKPVAWLDCTKSNTKIGDRVRVKETVFVDMPGQSPMQTRYVKNSVWTVAAITNNHGVDVFYFKDGCAAIKNFIHIKPSQSWF